MKNDNYKYNWTEGLFNTYSGEWESETYCRCGSSRRSSDSGYWGEWYDRHKGCYPIELTTGPGLDSPTNKQYILDKMSEFHIEVIKVEIMIRNNNDSGYYIHEGNIVKFNDYEMTLQIDSGGFTSSGNIPIDVITYIRKAKSNFK